MQRRILPEKNGDTIVFRRYSKLDTVPIPLVDGRTPPGAPLSATDIKARVSFYGRPEIAVVKSDLIDSKLLTSNVEDNEAQAFERMAA